MVRIFQKWGFASLTEVIITALIFVIAVFGIITATSMMQPKSRESRQRLEAAYLGKEKISELRGAVDAVSWDSSNSLLAPGTHPPEDFGDYTVSYTVTDHPDVDGRIVNMTISFPD